MDTINTDHHTDSAAFLGKPLGLPDADLVPAPDRKEWEIYQSGTGVISHLNQVERRWELT